MEADVHPQIQEAIRLVGSQAALARHCDCAQQTISKMLLRQISIAPILAKKIDEVTNGKVPRWQLRPDLWEAPSELASAP